MNEIKKTSILHKIGQTMLIFLIIAAGSLFVWAVYSGILEKPWVVGGIFGVLLYVFLMLLFISKSRKNGR